MKDQEIETRVGECQPQARERTGSTASYNELASAAQREALKQFARECLAGYVDGECGDLDGGWLQDKALELGLLVEGDGEDPLYYIAEWLK